MIGWQWHQLDHMQIICTSLQTDNHITTISVPAAQPTVSKHWRQTFTSTLWVKKTSTEQELSTVHLGDVLLPCRERLWFLNSSLGNHRGEMAKFESTILVLADWAQNVVTSALHTNNLCHWCCNSKPTTNRSNSRELGRALPLSCITPL